MGSKRKSKNTDATDVDTSALGDGRGRGGFTDERFLAANFDPKFQKFPKKRATVKIDDRFQRMFTDASFSSSGAPTDKRGRLKKKGGNSERSSLKHYYRIGGEEEEEEEEEEVEAEEETKSEKGVVDDVAMASELSDDDDDGDDENDEDDEEEESVDLEEESSTTDSEDEIGSDEDDEEGEEPEESVPTIDEETSRLAVVNLDWRHVKAVDLYVLLSSFLPKNGRVLSVTIYPSEFGLQRMKEEEIHGPVGLFEDDSCDDDADEDGDIDTEKLRAYERNRMRYYYAVVECDSSVTADHLYKTCDGGEFGRSSNVLDLRFIPNSMKFKNPPRDKATKVPENYDAKDFETRALQQSKINLTWDEDEPDRVKTLKRKFTADRLADLEVKDFLASDDSESDSEEDGDVSKDQSDKKGKKIENYRALIKEVHGEDGDEDDGDREMEITFNTDLEDLSKRIMEKKDKKSETVWEAYLRKRREKKKAWKNKSEHSSDEESSDADREVNEEQPDDFFLEEPPVKRSKKEKGHGKTRKSGKEVEEADAEGVASRAELELLLADDVGEDAGPKGYKIKTERAKRKKGNEGSKVPSREYDDPRFSALFTHPLYSLDPTHPDFKRSAAYARQLAERQLNGDRRELAKGSSTKPTPTAELARDESDINRDNDRRNSHQSTSIPGKTELSSLVKSVKMKSKLVQLSANDKTSKKKK